MTTYEFVFRDGQRLTGEGNGSAEAMLDAYHKNGFLPDCELVETVTPHPPKPSPDSDPGTTYMGKKKTHR